jgi:exosortase A
MASIVGRSEAPAAGNLLVRYAPLVAAALASIGILLVHADTVASMVAIWQRSETFAHGWLVVPICLWLAWRNRHTIAATPARPWYPALLIVAAAGAVWFLTVVADVIGVRQFALAFMVQAAIVAVVGLKVARTIAFPLAFLLFAVPFGEFLLPAMIDMTADFTVAALQLTGVPVYREGNHFVIPSGAWSVVEACSGLRYLIASVMVGVLYAAISYRSPVRKAAFIAASILVPLLANWLRAYMIVMIGHLSDNTLAVGVDHLIYGWLFFGLVMGLLFWIGSFWAEDTGPTAGSAMRPDATASHERPGTFYAVAVVAVMLAALWRPLYAAITPVPLEGRVTLAPIAAAGAWSASKEMPTAWTPNYSGFVADARQAFVSQGATAGVYVAYYRDQRKGRELVTTANQLVLPSEQRFAALSSTMVDVPLAGESRSVLRAEIAGLRDRFVAYRLYWVDGRLASGDAMAKALLAWSRLTRGTGDAALVVVYAPEQAGRDVARDALEVLWPSIERSLVATRNAR